MFESLIHICVPEFGSGCWGSNETNVARCHDYTASMTILCVTLKVPTPEIITQQAQLSTEKMMFLALSFQENFKSAGTKSSRTRRQVKTWLMAPVVKAWSMQNPERYYSRLSLIRQHLYECWWLQQSCAPYAWSCLLILAVRSAAASTSCLPQQLHQVQGAPRLWHIRAKQHNSHWGRDKAEDNPYYWHICLIQSVWVFFVCRLVCLFSLMGNKLPQDF